MTNSFECDWDFHASRIYRGGWARRSRLCSDVYLVGDSDGLVRYLLGVGRSWADAFRDADATERLVRRARERGA